MNRISSPTPGTGSELAESILWLIRLRWIAIAGVLVVTAISIATELLEHPYVSVGVALVMAGYNFAGWRRARSGKNLDSGRVEAEVFRQLALDLAALSVLLYFAGGISNPFVVFFSFHMAIGAMLLPLRKAVALGVLATLLHGGFTIGAALHWLPHHRLHLDGVGDTSTAYMSLLSDDAFFVAAYLAAFVLMLFGVMYFVHTIARRHRAEERLRRERERVAVSRERLARVGEISAGVAHTVRNPLHGVLSGLEIIKRQTAGDDRVQAVCDLVVEGLQRIERVTSRLLSLAREAPLQKVPTDLAQLVRETVKFSEIRVHKKGLEIDLDLADLPLVQVDPNRLSEALLNVIDNAVDACVEGDRIEIRTSRRGSAVVLEIADSGEGISAEALERVFDPFFTTKAVGEGTGLGLAIARRIAEEHGGRIEVSSQPGEGTRITFLIPHRFPGFV